MNIVQRLKYIWNLPEYYENLYRVTADNIVELDKKIGERTTVHADIGYKGTGSQIIVIGRYQNKDYVRSFNVRTENLGSLIELLRIEEKGANVGKFDMIGAMEFSAVYPYEKF